MSINRTDSWLIDDLVTIDDLVKMGFKDLWKAAEDDPELKKLLEGERRRRVAQRAMDREIMVYP